MDDYFDPFHLHPEKPVGLDHFQSLIKYSRGIDRDLRSHVPGRMLQGLLDRNGIEIFSSRFAERSAGSRENNSSDIGNIERRTPNAQRRIVWVRRSMFGVGRSAFFIFFNFAFQTLKN